VSDDAMRDCTARSARMILLVMELAGSAIA
jgi:hypothetical protein